MLNLKKPYILKIINIVITGIFIIDTVAYGYTPSNKSSLRVPSMTTTKEGQERLKDGMDQKGLDPITNALLKTIELDSPSSAEIKKGDKGLSLSRGEPDTLFLNEASSGNRFNLIRRKDGTDGFYDMLLSFDYARGFLNDERNWSSSSEEVRKIITDVRDSLKNKNKGPRRLATFWVRFYENLKDNNGTPKPLYIFLKTEDGLTVKLEQNIDATKREHSDYLEMLSALTSQPEDFTAMLLLVGMLRHGLDMEAFRQSSAVGLWEGTSVIKEAALEESTRCDACQACATHCPNMAAIRLPKEDKVKFKSLSQACTTCQLCTSCPLHHMVAKAGLVQEDERDQLYVGGEAHYSSGKEAKLLLNNIQNMLGDSKEKPWRDLIIKEVHQGQSIEKDARGNPLYDIIQYEIAFSDGRVKPWLITALIEPGEKEDAQITLIRRPKAEVLIPITTQTGDVEIAMAGRAQIYGAFVRGVRMPQTRFGGGHKAVALFLDKGLLDNEKLIDLVKSRPNIVMAATPDDVPPEVQEHYLDKVGAPIHFMSPLPRQAHYPTQDPLISSLEREAFDIFSDEELGKELRQVEQRIAKGLLDRLLANDPTVTGEILTRYSRWAVAPGSTMCPGCQQHLVYSAPILMAILVSLSNSEIPIIVDSKTTSCWSENNARQLPADLRGGTTAKFPTNRTLYGAHPSSVEAISMTYNEAVENGYLVPKTLYDTAGTGDGGAYIGWDAQGNLNRALGRLVPRKHSHTQVGIILVDNQFYANTGGEASASSFGSTKTSPTGLTQAGILSLGVAYLPLSVEDAVAQMPGWFVGGGTSADLDIVFRHYARAYLMKRPAYYKAITPCIDILGLPGGMDPNKISILWELAGLSPVFEYVGKLMKRMKPRQYSGSEPLIDGVPQSIHRMIKDDPRFSAFLDKDGRISRDPLVRSEIQILVRYRNWLNWWLDFGTPIAEQAEKYSEEFFQKLESEYKRNPNFKYSHLFDPETGKLKAEFGEGLKRDFLEAVVGVDFIKTFTARKEGLDAELKAPLKEYFTLHSEIKGLVELIERLKVLNQTDTAEYREAQEKLEKAQKKLPQLFEKAHLELKDMTEKDGFSALIGKVPQPDSVSKLEPFRELEQKEIKASEDGFATQEEARTAYFNDTFDGILNDLSQAKLANLTESSRRKEEKKNFIDNGGLINKKSFIKKVERGEEYRRRLARIGGCPIRVLSVSGFGGITINRIKQFLDRARGAFTQVVVDFKSARRFDMVDAGTDTSSQKIRRKDWLKGLLSKAVVAPEHEYTKTRPFSYVNNLDPFGVLIINTLDSPEDVREELIGQLPEKLQNVINEVKSMPLEKREDLEKLQNLASNKLYGKDYVYLNNLLDRFIGKSKKDRVNEVIALSKVHVITVDADGIMSEVGLDTKENPHNLVVNSLFYHLDNYLGLPVNIEEEIPILRTYITRIVGKDTANQYIEAIEIAYKRAQGVPEKGSYPVLIEEKDLDPLLYKEGPEGLFPIQSGGQIAAFAASQICTEDFPGYYIGFPITPSSYFLWTFASLEASGNPYILSVDENNLSEKVAVQKILMAAKSGLAIIINATSSQGLLLYGEGIPMAVGMRIPVVFVITGRAKSAPLLSIKSSQEDILTFEKDGPIILMAKDNEEVAYMTYLAKALALTLSYPVLVYQEGFTDSHRIEDMPMLTDQEIRAWDRFIFENRDYLRDTIFNAQGDILMTGASADSETYIEGRAMTEKVLESARYLLPYLTHTLDDITGYRFKAVEAYTAKQKTAQHRVVTMGGRTANFKEALDILERNGFRGLFSLIRPSIYTPFPDKEVAEAFGWSQNKGARGVQDGLAVVFDMSPGSGKAAPLAGCIKDVSADYLEGKPNVVSIRAGEGSRETVAEDIADYLLFLHLITGDKPERAELEFVRNLIDTGDKEIVALMKSVVAEKVGAIEQEASVPDFIPVNEILERIKKEHKDLLMNKDYAKVLTRIYGRVSFFDINEMYEQTKTYFKLLIAMEILGARHFLKEANLSKEKLLRYSLVLLEYSQDKNDHILAVTTLDKIINGKKIKLACEAANIFDKNAKYQELIQRVGQEITVPASVRQRLNKLEKVKILEPLSDAEEIIPEETRRKIEMQLKEAMERNPYPELLEKKDKEIGLLETAINEVARESKFEPLNPVDVERLALERLTKNRDSQVYGHEIFARGDERLYVEGYRLTYRQEIDACLTRSIIPFSFAPELKSLFTGEGLENLKRLISTSVVLRSAVGAEAPTADDIESDLLDYFEKIIYPEFSQDSQVIKKPVEFYTNYYYLAEQGRMREKIKNELASNSSVSKEKTKPAFSLDKPEDLTQYRKKLYSIIECSRWQDIAIAEKDKFVREESKKLLDHKDEKEDINLLQALIGLSGFDIQKIRQIVEDWVKTAQASDLILKLKTHTAKAKTLVIREEIRKITNWIRGHYKVKDYFLNALEERINGAIKNSIENQVNIEKARENLENKKDISNREFIILAQYELAKARHLKGTNGRTMEEEMLNKIKFFNIDEIDLGFWANLIMLQEQLLKAPDTFKGVLRDRTNIQRKNLSSEKADFLISELLDLVIFVQLSIEEKDLSIEEIEGLLKGHISSELMPGAWVNPAVWLISNRIGLEKKGLFWSLPIEEGASRLRESREIVTVKDLQMLIVYYLLKKGLQGAEWNKLLDEFTWQGFNITKVRPDRYVADMVDPVEIESFERVNSENGFSMLCRPAETGQLSGDIHKDLGIAGIDPWNVATSRAGYSLEDIQKGEGLHAQKTPIPQLGGGQAVVRYILIKELSKLRPEELAALDIHELSALSYEDLLNKLSKKELDIQGSIGRAVGSQAILLAAMVKKGYPEYGFSSNDGSAKDSDLKFYTYRTLLKYIEALERVSSTKAVANLEDLDAIARYEYILLREDSGDIKQDTKLMLDKIKSNYDATLVRNDYQILSFEKFISDSLGVGVVLQNIAENVRDGVPLELVERILRQEAVYFYKQAAASDKEIQPLEITRDEDLDEIVTRMVIPASLRSQDVNQTVRGELSSIFDDVGLFQLKSIKQKPVIALQDELKILIKYKLNQIVGPEDWESYRSVHKFSEIRDEIGQWLSQFTINPGLMHPQGLNGLILEVIEDVRVGPAEGWEGAKIDIEEMLRTTGPADCRRCGEPTCALYALHTAQGKLNPLITPCLTLGENSIEMARIRNVYTSLYEGGGSGKAFTLSGEEWERVFRYLPIEQRIAYIVLAALFEKAISPQEGLDDKFIGIIKAFAPGVVSVSRGRFDQQILGLVGKLVYSKISDNEREFLMSHGQEMQRLNEERFDEEGDPMLKAERKNEPVVANQRREPRYKARVKYQDIVFIDELPDEDKELILQKREIDAINLLREGIEKAFILLKSPSQIESIDELLIILEAKFWERIKLPLLEEVKRHLPDNGERLLKEHIQYLEAAKKDGEVSKETLIEKVLQERNIAQTRGSFEMDQLQLIIGRFISKIQDEIKADFEKDEEYDKERLINKVYKALADSNIQIHPMFRFGWLYLNDFIQDYLKTSESGKKVKEETAEFMGQESQYWDEMPMLFQEALLKACIANEVENLVRLNKRKPATVKSEGDILDEVIMERIVAGVKNKLEVRKGLEEKQERSPLVEEIDKVLSSPELLMVPEIKELINAISQEVNIDSEIIPYFTPIGPLNLMLLSKMDEYSSQRFLDLQRRYKPEEVNMRGIDTDSFLNFVRNPVVEGFLKGYGLGGLSQVEDGELHNFIESQKQDIKMTQLKDVETNALLSLMGRFVAATNIAYPAIDRFLEAQETEFNVEGLNQLKDFQEKARKVIITFYVIADLLADRDSILRQAEAELINLGATLTPKADMERGRELDEWRAKRGESLKRIFKESVLLVKKAHAFEASSFENEIFQYYLNRRLIHRFELDKSGEGLPLFVLTYIACQSMIQPQAEDLYRFIVQYKPELLEEEQNAILSKTRFALQRMENLFFETLSKNSPQFSEALAGNQMPPMPNQEFALTSSFLQINRPGPENKVEFEFKDYATEEIAAKKIATEVDGMHLAFHPEKNITCEFNTQELRGNVFGSEGILRQYSRAITVSTDGDKPPDLNTEEEIYSMLEGNLSHILHVLKKWNSLYNLDLSKVRLTSGMAHAGRLTTEDKVVEIAVEALINPHISADFILDDILTHAVIRNSKLDNRIPKEFSYLAEEMAVIWHTLERIKLLQSQGGKLDSMLIDLFKWYRDENSLNLLTKFIGRNDLSEEDEIFFWIIEHIKSQDIYRNLRLQIERLEELKNTDYEQYEKVVEGMIDQSKANIGKLPKIRTTVKNVPIEKAEDVWRALILHIGQLAYDRFKLNDNTEEFLNLPVPAIWERIEKIYAADLNHHLAQRYGTIDIEIVQEKAKQFNDSYEKACLLLFAETDIPGVPHNRRFIQFLLEDKPTYNRLLAASYIPQEEKKRLLDDILKEFEVRAENFGLKLGYTDEQKDVLLKAIYLRPDIVKQVIRKEYKKDIYKGLSIAGQEATRGKVALKDMGLYKNLYAFHSVLHTLQEIFGSITPEVYLGVAEGLGISREFLNQTIIFYPRFVTTPAGDVEVRLCRWGGACILEGVADIADEIHKILGAAEGIATDRLQVFHDACIGRCFLAPAMMTIDRRTGKVTFFGPLEREKITSLLEFLVGAPTYPTKHGLFQAAKEGLGPGKDFYISEEHKVELFSGFGAEDNVKGRIAAIDYNGNVYLVPTGDLGKFLDRKEGFKVGDIIAERIVSFEYINLEGKPDIATLVISDQLKVLDVINYGLDPELAKKAKSLVKPQVYLDEETQKLYLRGEETPLGKVNTNTIAIKNDSGKAVTITFAGENKSISLRAIPIEEEDTLASEPPGFVENQKRLLFAKNKIAPAWDSEQALNSGIMDPVYSVLRLGRDFEPLDAEWSPWSQEAIFSLIGNSLLQGRGGALFPVLPKWRSLKQAVGLAIDEGKTKSFKLADGLIVMIEKGRARIVINADEGDPQAYRDREVVEKRPYQLIAGASVIAIALGIQEIDVFIRAEYKLAVNVFKRAIHQARARGWLGRDIYGIKGLNVDMEIRPGSGNFLSGEARAISFDTAGYIGLPPREKTKTLESHAGFLSSAGGGQRVPTLVQNVTTTALVGELVGLAAPKIDEYMAKGNRLKEAIGLGIQDAGREFVAMGYGGTGGPIAVTTSGQILKYQGVLEHEGAVVLRKFYEILGLERPGKKLFAAQFAGPAGEMLKLDPDAFIKTGEDLTVKDWAWLFDAELSPVFLRFVDWIIGSAAIGFAAPKVDFLEFVHTYISWLATESDGQCPGCLNPAHVLADRLERIRANNGTSKDIWSIRSIVTQIKKQNVECGLGKNLPSPVSSSMRSLPVDYLYRLLRNPRADRMDILESLYALDLIDREIIDSNGSKKKIYDIKKHSLRLIVDRLTEIDGFKPANERVTARFLRMLEMVSEDVRAEQIDINNLSLKVNYSGLSRQSL